MGLVEYQPAFTVGSCNKVLDTKVHSLNTVAADTRSRARRSDMLQTRLMQGIEPGRVTQFYQHSQIRASTILWFKKQNELKSPLQLRLA